MQDDLTGATSTPADETSVRADLEAALAGWGEDEGATASTEPATEAKAAGATEQAAGQEKTASERARDEKGRFAPKDASQPAEAQAATQAAVTEQPAEQQITEPAAQSVEGRPPPGWSVASKAAWEQIPPHIRADIVKREEEVNNGFAKLRDYKGLDQYAAMAKQSGTTLETALQNYVGMEQMLRRDPKQGLIAIAQNVGLNQQQLAQLFGAAPSHQTGPANGATQGDQQATGYEDDPYVQAAVQAALKPVTEKLGSLEGYFQNLKQTDQQRQLSQAQKVVDEFAASDQYRYYSDVEETINNLLVKGLVTRTGDFRADLATAYDMACQLHPEVREALINERISKTEEKRRAEAEKAEADKRAKAASATRAAVSVRGAPSGPVSAPAGSKGGVRDDLAAAWDAHS
jgi:hypothetical protein